MLADDDQTGTQTGESDYRFGCLRGSREDDLESNYL